MALQQQEQRREASRARGIAEELLTHTGRAMETGDFELFETCFMLPHEIQTFQGSNILTTRSDLARVFRQVRGYYAKLGVTRLARACVDAEFLDEFTLQSTHVSHLLNGTTLVRESYPTLSVISHVGDRWRCAKSIYAVNQDRDHEQALIS